MFKRIKQNYNVATIEETNQFGYMPSELEIQQPDKSLDDIQKQIEIEASFRGLH